MGIKLSKDSVGLINTLKSRNLVFNETEAVEYFKKTNYFNVINGLETLLLPDSNNNCKVYETETLDDFRAVYEFDRDLASIVFKKLNEIESILKTTISINFTNKYCANLNDTMQYTNKEKYIDPKVNDITHINYCKYSENYPFKNKHYRGIYNGFNDFLFFEENYLNRLVNYNDHINKHFYKDSRYMAPENVNKYFEDNTVAVPMWVAIETISFGQLIRLIHYLDDDILENILKGFNLNLNERNQFLNMLDILLELRNSCAHLSLINRFKTSKVIKINSSLVTIFQMNPKEYNPYSVISLYDSLKILSYFVDLKELENPFDTLILRNIKYFNSPHYNLNERLLTRMGNPNYIEWVDLFRNKISYVY